PTCACGYVSTLDIGAFDHPLYSCGGEYLAQGAVLPASPSVHPDTQARQLGLVKLCPPFLIEPSLRLRDVPSLDALPLAVRPVSFGAGNDDIRIDSQPQRRLKFRPRGLFRVGMCATVRIHTPEALEVVLGAIFRLHWTGARERARASRRSMCVCVDHLLFYGLFSPQRCGHETTANCGHPVCAVADTCPRLCGHCFVIERDDVDVGA